MTTYDSALDDWRTMPVYSITQAARLAGVAPVTVKRWLYGQDIEGARMRPVFGGGGRLKESAVEVSFLQLLEIVVASRFRRKGVTLERLRRAHEYARKQLHAQYPFS